MAKLLSLAELYENKLFRIPDYQRGYAWKKEQLKDFWDDLINLHNGRYHYTGLLSLKEIKGNQLDSLNEDRWLTEIGFKAFHIVDGQQRITTFSILLNEIISFVIKLPANNGKFENEIVLNYQTIKSLREKYISKKRPPNNLITTYLFGYENNNHSAKYLIHKVFNEPFSETIHETYYTQNLRYAKDFFNRSITELYEAEGIFGLEKLFIKLTNQMKFNLHEIDDEYDVFVAFETMNNRGKRLTNLELLKNRLIYLTTLYDDVEIDEKDKSDLRKKINGAWKEVYYQLGRNKDAPLIDDEFLNAHRTIYFGYSRKKGNDYIKFLLNKFSSKNIFEKQSLDIEEYSQDVLEDEEFEEENDNGDEVIILTSKLQPVEISDYVNSLKDLAKYWFFTYFPSESSLSDQEKLWIEKLNRIGIAYFRPLVAVALSKKQANSDYDVLELLQAIERYIFICFRIGGYQSSYKSSEIYGRTKDLYYDKVTISELAGVINDYSEQDKEYALDNFMINMDKRFSQGTGFYGWRDLRYLLFEYEYSIAETTGINKLDWAPFAKPGKDKVSIEHILPQKPTKWYWQNQFRDYSENEKNTLSASLGNLLALSQSVNSSLQNDSFEEKKNPTRKGRRGYSDGSHSEIRVSRYNDWTPKKILDRGLELLTFMENRWNVKFKDINQKIKLLHLDFVNDNREITPEIKSLDIIDVIDDDNVFNDRMRKQYKFWLNFIEYCKINNRDSDLGKRSPRADNSYDIAISRDGYNIFTQVYLKKTIRVGLYVYGYGTFGLLEEQKDKIEELCGFKLDWYSSREGSTDKRILYSMNIKWDDETNYLSCFKWFAESIDSLVSALNELGL